MKYTLILLMLCSVLVSCRNEEKKFTVEFIKDGDTSYLMNTTPLTLSEANKIAEGFTNGKATPVLFDSVWKRDNIVSLPKETITLSDSSADEQLLESYKTVKDSPQISMQDIMKTYKSQP